MYIIIEENACKFFDTKETDWQLWPGTYLSTFS